MERQVVESSALRSIGYDAERSIVEVEFKDGILWQYFGVPESVWYNFELSESKGKFFTKEIRNVYTASQV